MKEEQETMIEFKPITLETKAVYERYLLDGKERGCDYTFANLYLWGRQRATILHDHMVLFSQYNRRSVYPYPLGSGDKKPVLDAIIADADKRGIPCRITGVGEDARKTLEELYPGMFRFHCDRDAYDYVYAIDDLADLKGRKYHRKRNHYKRFQNNFPDYTVAPLSQENLPRVRQMITAWYENRLKEHPESDYHMERAALEKALRQYRELEMEGLVLLNGDDVLAVTMGSRVSDNTIDVQFEKARSDVDGAYTAINCEFARYLRNKYPHIQFLNREEDMGIEGLRKAKQSYYPHHMIEKCWACLLEEGYEY